MRLIDTTKLELHGFSSKKKPPYAILSHRWTDSEVLFADICSNNDKAEIGFLKIEGTAKLAKEHGLEYLWVDTCCIDKQSSAELSEAINSMYNWYADAEICYVYLQDVDKNDGERSFRESEWFDRGWTLQELLAPEHVYFYDRYWQFLGSKRSMATDISTITGVHVEALIDRLSTLQTFSVAQRLSWAARRITTRLEDRAYCLMGLFDVNMPLLYGEGEKAFLRLQEEIIKDSDDHTIFAWSMGDCKCSGLLAPSPFCFAASREVQRRPYGEGQDAFSITNRGLSITLKLVPWSVDTYLAILGCCDLPADRLRVSDVGIFLRRLTEDDQYARVKHGLQDLLAIEHLPRDMAGPTKRHLYVRKNPDIIREVAHLQDRIYGFRFLSWLSCYSTVSDDSGETTHPGLKPESSDNELQPGFNEHLLLIPEFPQSIIRYSGRAPVFRIGQTVVIDISKRRRGLSHISVGFDDKFNPVCCVEASPGSVSRHSTHMSVLASHGFKWSYDLSDTPRWTETYRGSQVYFRNRGSGVWALKGHRVHGLILREGKLTMKIFERSEITHPETTHLENPQLVWDVSIESLAQAFEHTLSRSKDARPRIGIYELQNAMNLLFQLAHTRPISIHYM